MATATSAAHHLPRVRARRAVFLPLNLLRFPAATRVLGHGRPLTAFFPYPAKALPAAMTPPTTLSAPSQPPPPMPAPVPKSSSSRTARDRRAHAPQALICPHLSDQKALEHLSLPCLSGVFISFSFMRLHLICSIQSASIFHTCQPAQVEIPCSGLSFALPVFLHPSLSS